MLCIEWLLWDVSKKSCDSAARQIWGNMVQISSAHRARRSTTVKKMKTIEATTQQQEFMRNCIGKGLTETDAAQTRGGRSCP